MTPVNLKKVADLDKVVQLCDAIGPNYTPGNEALMPTALTSLRDEAEKKMKAVNSAQVATAMLTKQRSISFKGIPALSVRIVRLVMSSQATVAEKMQAREIKRKFFHTSKSKVTKTPVSDTTPVPKSPRSNYRDYAGRLAGLEQLIYLVSTIRGYKSMEPELTLEGLNKTFAELQALHVAVIGARMSLTEARKARNEIIAAPGGVSATVNAVKDYLRSKYGHYNSTLPQIDR
jgi:hypothetical protein